MKIRRVYVTRKNPAEIFLVIEDALAARPHTQVFIDNKIYVSLKDEGIDYHVYSHYFMTLCHHYDRTAGETWFALHNGGIFDKIVARGSFVQNCEGYKQLVEFHSSKVKDYRHNCAGFKQLLLILFKTE